MKMAIGLSSASLAAIMLIATPAAALNCKSEVITATSRKYISRSLGAFPGSWAAWRKEVKKQVGDGWQAWRRAEDRKINCAQNDGRWTCTRSARPCRPGDGPSGPGVIDHDYVPINMILSRRMEITRRNRRKVEAQVKTLQHLLNEAGDYKLAEDGDFGRSTEDALIDFQRKNKLTVDGKAGPQTLEALTS